MSEEEEDNRNVKPDKSSKPINNKEVFGPSKIQIKYMKDMKDLDELKEE